jgi:trehalose 6-phosphate phosphatase
MLTVERLYWQPPVSASRSPPHNNEIMSGQFPLKTNRPPVSGHDFEFCKLHSTVDYVTNPVERPLFQSVIVMDGSHFIPPRPQKEWVYFLDFDGTLVDIAERPEGVRVKGEMVNLLEKLSRATAGAVILVSGRPISELDFHLRPLRLRAAGLHGLEYRMHPGGSIEGNGPSTTVLDPARRRLAAFAAEHEGVQLEDKGVSLALHFRRAPEIETPARRAAESACRALGPAFACLPGKMVYEIKPRWAHKGQVIEKFMNIGNINNRRPVFVGDDVTDEDGFRVCNLKEGVSIRVGNSNTPTAATFRLEDVKEVEAWLGQLIDVESGLDS